MRMTGHDEGGKVSKEQPENNIVLIPKRKGIPQSVRFEIFKRDSFTCQYCGGKAPDVILHVDHIKPVADGGENEIVNLVTSCADCNGGKGARALDDSSIIEKQRRQLDELNEHRQQLEMMLQWREGLRDVEGEYLAAVQKELIRRTGWGANETGERDIRKWIAKYTLQEIFAAIDTSVSQYFQDDETWGKTFGMVPRIIEMNRRGGLSAEMKSIYYARGIIRRRLSYLKEDDLIWLMKEAVASGLDTEDLIDFCKRVRNWKNFEDELWRIINEAKNGKD